MRQVEGAVIFSQLAFSVCETVSTQASGKVSCNWPFQFAKQSAPKPAAKSLAE